jgi:malate dehydrogenase (oxaloacetate-decarboxylating)(NADP+)
VPTAWAFRSGSCSSTLRRLECRRRACYRLPGCGHEQRNLSPGSALRRPAAAAPLKRGAVRVRGGSSGSLPDCCIHFEDWTGVDAVALLARYRNKASCYNDDIQGTAGVTLAGLINAFKITGGEFKEQRILFLGAGSAAIGLADLIVSALGEQGVAPDLARQQIRMFDTQGLVVAGRPGLAAHKLPYAHELAPSKPFNHLDLAREYPQIVAAIEDFKPTALIGVSTVGKLFSREIVEAMSRANARPIIFALSNHSI